MSAEPHNADGFELSLDRPEAWVIHHAVLDHVELTLSDNQSPAPRDLNLLEKLETDTHTFTAPELIHLRELCTTLTNGSEAPDRDITAATTVIDEIDTVLGGD